MPDIETAEQLQLEIARANKLIQDVLIANDVKLFAAICAMVAIIRCFKKDHPDSSPAIDAMDNLIEKYASALVDLPEAPTQVH